MRPIVMLLMTRLSSRSSVTIWAAVSGASIIRWQRGAALMS